MQCHFRFYIYIILVDLFFSTFLSISHNKLEFFAGLGPLASVMDVATKLQFSFEVYDHKNTGELRRDDIMVVLSGA